jgi:hypothetical protein
MLPFKNAAVALGLALSFLAPASALANPASLHRLLRTGWARALLTETRAGAELAERIAGKPVRDVADLIDLRARIEAADPRAARLRAELEPRLESIRAELEAQGASRGRPSAPLLEELATRHLGLADSARWERAGRLGAIEFVAAAPEAFPAARARLLAAAPEASSFEAAVEVAPLSIEGRLPASAKIYDRLVALERRFLESEGLADPDRASEQVRARLGGRNPTLKDILDHVVQARQELARELQALSARYRGGNDLLSGTLSKAAHEIRLNDSALRKYAAKAPELASVDYQPGRHFEDFTGYTAKLRGELGELRVAVREEGVVARGAEVEAIGRFFGTGRAADRARAELQLLATRTQGLLRKELDLVFRGGAVWGEVKYYREPLARADGHWETVAAQAAKTLELKRLLEANPAIRAALGGPIELRIYFVSGVSDDAAAALEAMGYRVLGPRGPAEGLPLAPAA